jgi:hypothetical protein
MRPKLIIGIILLIFIVLFRGSLYRLFFSYKDVGVRIEYPLNAELSSYIEEQCKDENPEKIREVINLSLRITSGSLFFSSSGKTKIDPAELPSGSPAHCIGYSAYFNTVCNYLIWKYGFTDWKSEQHIGQIHFAGINVHSFLRSAFFADHDYNIIKNRDTGQMYSTDPTLFDYLRIELVKNRN